MDQIYHLACPASPPHYQYNPIKTIKTSAMGTINMLGLAKRVKARILLTSTSEVRRRLAETPAHYQKLSSRQGTTHSPPLSPADRPTARTTHSPPSHPLNARPPTQVYGDPQIHPQPESYWGNVNPIGPRACYDEGKRVAETMMYAYRNQSESSRVRGSCVLGNSLAWSVGRLRQPTLTVPLFSCVS